MIRGPAMLLVLPALVTVGVIATATFGGDELRRVLSLADYNTRIVVLGTTLLGAAAGLIGTFTYLRKRAMVADALAHATLPGIAAAFLVVGQKEIVPLLVGGAIAGTLGVLCVMGLRRIPRIHEDAAIGIVLSVFFGVGLILKSAATQLSMGDQAGLDRFIYGTTAGLIKQDAWLIGMTAVLILLTVLLLFKEFRLLCFDAAYARSLGRRVRVLDLLMMALVVITTVVGLQAVGLILVIALLIIPAAAARFWTDDLATMTWLSVEFGAASGFVGALISGSYANLPAGAVIVICAGVLFFFSMGFAPERGAVFAWWRRYALRRRIGRQHVLRALAEHEERYGHLATLPLARLQQTRSWRASELRNLIYRCRAADELTIDPSDNIRLTPTGRVRAHRLLRNHRLWELYLIRYADVAPTHVDRDADQIEHVLPAAITVELERLLAEKQTAIPASPHPMGDAS